ncbi:OmpA family protein [Gordonia aichiensis]|uniref:OmpA family protein n=1 Tax=Gordonia aichiensis TaxID=36820 RepID=UPI00034ADD16
MGARELSTSRAQAVADALVSGGLHRSLIRTVRGVGYDETITPPNAGPDEVAQANRAVIIEIVR